MSNINKCLIKHQMDYRKIKFDVEGINKKPCPIKDRDTKKIFLITYLSTSIFLVSTKLCPEPDEGSPACNL